MFKRKKKEATGDPGHVGPTGPKGKAVVVKKVYCGQCKHVNGYYCKANPETLSQEWLAPGKTIQHNTCSAVKNRDNNCPDFKQKRR